MKKILILSMLLAFFPFSIKASNPYENLKIELKVSEDLAKSHPEFKMVAEYYADIHRAPEYSIQLDPFCEKGIQQILTDIHKIRETDKTNLIFVFFDVDQFTFWKDGVTPSYSLKREEMDNFYDGEEHTSLFRDPKFPEVIQELKELGCRVHGLTARHSGRKNYSSKTIFKIKKMCEKLQANIGFDLFPESFQDFLYHNLSDEFLEPLFGYSGIFLTGQKTRAIQYLFENGEKLKFFDQKPSHIIFGDDWAGNLLNMSNSISINFNLKLYHWPYPYEINEKFFPIMKMHRDNKNELEAHTHVEYILTSHIYLYNYVIDLIGDIQKIEKPQSKIIKTMIDVLLFDKKTPFIDLIELSEYDNINAIIRYLKWNNENHKSIQKYLTDRVLVSCLLGIAENIHQHFYKEASLKDGEDESFDEGLFSLTIDDILENKENMPVLMESPRAIDGFVMSPIKKIVSWKKKQEFMNLYNRLWKFLEPEANLFELSYENEERMLSNLVREFVCLYALGDDEIEDPYAFSQYIENQILNLI